MITKLTVENFKALRRVELELTPLTVLIGPNNSGKSSFLEAIYAISRSAHFQLNRCFWSSWQHRELVHGNDPDAAVKFIAEFPGFAADGNGTPGSPDPIFYSLAISFSPGHVAGIQERIGGLSTSGSELPRRQNSTAICGKGSIPSNLERSVDLVRRNLSPAMIARWDIEELASPSRIPTPPDRSYPFDASGYGLASCIAEIKLDRQGYFEALRSDFCERFPEFQDIIVRRALVHGFDRDERFQKVHDSRGEGYALVFLRKDGVEIPAGLASGGILVTLAFLTLVHLPEPRKLLLIEEPENALHPGRLREVIATLRRTMSMSKDSQIILTTHSPLLLDFVEPEEVRLFVRDEHDDVNVFNMADIPDIRERLKYLMLGELVYNEGEQELVKEIQQHANISAR